MLFEIITEVCGFLKTQGISDFIDIPAAMLEEGFCFLCDA